MSVVSPCRGVRGDAVVTVLPAYLRPALTPPPRPVPPESGRGDSGRAGSRRDASGRAEQPLRGSWPPLRRDLALLDQTSPNRGRDEGAGDERERRSLPDQKRRQGLVPFVLPSPFFRQRYRWVPYPRHREALYAPTEVPLLFRGAFSVSLLPGRVRVPPHASLHPPTSLFLSPVRGSHFTS